MDFFKSVFSDDTELQDRQKNQKSPVDSPKKTSEVEEDMDQEIPLDVHDSSPSPKSNSAGGSAWSFGGMIKTFASKSESVLQTYRRDLEEFSSGLKKETAVIREVASRAVKELPVSLDVGASVAQESLESVGQAIDNLGSSVWRGTSEIISQGKDAFLASDLENDSPDSPNLNNPNLSSKKYSRFEAQVHAIQTDLNTYCEEPDDLDDFNKWRSGFVLGDKADEVENLLAENGSMDGIYSKLVPSNVDHETFWNRYFYRVHKLKLAEDARADLVKRVISRDEEEDLSWDVDDDDDDDEINASELKGKSSENLESVKKDSIELATEKKPIEESQVSSNSEVLQESGEKSSQRDFEDKDHVAKSLDDDGSNEKAPVEGLTSLSTMNNDEFIAKSDEKMCLEGKGEPSESCKDSDLSIISSQPSLPEEEDLGWDEIEDLGSNDEKKVTPGGSPNKADLRKRLSAAEEEEDLSWDIEDDDEPVKH